MMTVKEFQVGIVGTNCFLAVNSETKETLIIDPGDYAAALADDIEKNALHPVAVLLTHGHFDHCMAAEQLAKQYGISIYVHEDDKQTMENPAYNCCGMIGKILFFMQISIFMERQTLYRWQDLTWKYCIRRDIRQEESVFMLRVRGSYLVETHCFASL